MQTSQQARAIAAFAVQAFTTIGREQLLNSFPIVLINNGLMLAIEEIDRDA